MYYLPTYLPTYLPIYLSTYLPIYLPTCATYPAATSLSRACIRTQVYNRHVQ